MAITRSVAGMVETDILESKRGKVRLLAPEDVPAHWDPATGLRFAARGIVQHLVRALASGGEGAAAEFVAKLGGVGGRPEIARLAREGGKPRAAQGAMFGETEE